MSKTRHAWDRKHGSPSLPIPRRSNRLHYVIQGLTRAASFFESVLPSLPYVIIGASIPPHYPVPTAITWAQVIRHGLFGFLSTEKIPMAENNKKR